MNNIQFNKIQKRMIKASKIAGQCRRNWTYEKFDDSDLHTITTAATNMPTKQNVLNYELVVSTNTTVNEKFYRVSVPYDGNFAPYNNGQVNAPLLYIWCDSPRVEEIMEMNNQHTELRHTSVGISSGAAALTATYLGYETGFCKCFDNVAVQNILKTYTGREKLNPLLMLGVGHPKMKRPGVPERRSHCYLGDELMHTSKVHTNKIKLIHYI